MATFLLASMKRKDSEVNSEHHSDLALLSHPKKIRLSLGFEAQAHASKEQDRILQNKSVKRLQSSSDNLNMMTAAEEMITENELDAARTSIFHNREEKEEGEEEAMEVEDGNTDDGLHQKQEEELMAEEAVQPIRVAPVNMMIWSGFF